MSLPLWNHAAALKQFFSTNSLVIVHGETGSGKSLALPDLLWQVLGGRVVCTQPRVVAAQKLAERKASEWGGRVPGWVGFEGGSEKFVAPSTVLVYATTGAILAKRDTMMTEYTGIILDECHEISEEFELLLLLALEAKNIHWG